MSENRNVQTVKAIYQLYQENPAKGVKLLVENLAPGIQWRSVADQTMRGLKFAYDRNSKLEVEEYFDDIAAEWEPISIDIDHYTAQEDRVVVCGTGKWRNRSTGKIVSSAKVDVYHFENGSIKEFCEFFDTAKVVNAATLDE